MYVNILVTLYLLYLLFQENKSFDAITLCIHPLMTRSRVGNMHIHENIDSILFMQHDALYGRHRQSFWFNANIIMALYSFLLYNQKRANFITALT